MYASLEKNWLLLSGKENQRMKMGSVTLQDAEQWISFFTRMAEEEQLDTSQAFVNNCKHALYPVEKACIVLEETNPQQVKETVEVEMVTPIQETVEQAKSEYSESKFVCLFESY